MHLLLLLALHDLAAAATWDVCPTGVVMPYCAPSIESAHTKAANGDTINLLPGDHLGGAEIFKDSLKLVGAGIGVTRVIPSVTNEMPALRIAGAVGLEISGITFSGADLNGQGHAAILAEDSDLTISDCELMDGHGGPGSALDVIRTSAVLDAVLVRGNSGSAVHVDGTSTLTATASTFSQNATEDPDAMGGAVQIHGDASFIDCIFDDNDAVSGGHLAALEGSELRIEGGTLDRGSATNAGGAVYAEGATVIVSGADFSTNEGAEGGAITVLGGALTVTSATFFDNLADVAGGAILAAYGVVVDVSASSFSENDALVGGAILSADNPTTTITTSTFLGNEAVASGGSLYLQDGLRTERYDLVDTSFLSGSANVGGAIARVAEYVDDAGQPTGAPIVPAEMDVLNVVFFGNLADFAGALFASEVGAISFADTTFTSNGANAAGAMKVFAVGALDVLRTDFCGNHADDTIGGAAVIEFVGVGTWSNSALVANEAAANGGAIHCLQSSLDVSNATMFGNVGALGASAYFDRCTSTLTNNIVTENVGQGVTQVNSTLTFYTNDFWDNPNGDCSVPAASRPTDLAVDPGFEVDPTADPCTLDWSLLPGSPLVDVGTGTDLDGSIADLGVDGGPGGDPDDWIDSDLDGWLAVFDCDDLGATVFPGAIETCDEVDQDCDGIIDDILLYSDLDGDGYGDPNDPVTECPGGTAVDNALDCGPSDAATSPESVELCNTRDDDCDGVVDDDPVDLLVFYADVDQDGYGNPNVTSTACEPPVGFTDNPDDCHDGDPALNPETTWYVDGDGDGFGREEVVACDPGAGHSAEGADCDDDADDVFPGAVEACDDVDSDCDTDLDDPDALGVVELYVDADGDGFGDRTRPQSACAVAPGLVDDDTDCDDGDGETYPGAEDPLDDDLDQDCNGFAAGSWLESGSGCACATGRSPSGGWGLLALAATMALRRRRAS